MIINLDAHLVKYTNVAGGICPAHGLAYDYPLPYF